MPRIEYDTSDFAAKAYARRKNQYFGALVVMEASRPKRLECKWKDVCARVAGVILGGDMADETARLSFEPDKVEWVMRVSPQQLQGGIWLELDNLLASIVEEACR